MENSTDLINRAWQRITESESELDFDCAAPPRRSEYICAKSRSANDMLREFIAAERNFSAFFDSLLKCAKSPRAASVFKQIISDSRAHSKKLQTEYFILTCDTYCPKSEKTSVRSSVCALREGYMRKVKSADGYKAAANESANAAFAAMLEDFALDESRHAAALRGLIECVMN